MRIFNLVAAAPLSKLWFATVSAWIFWLAFYRVYGDGAVSFLNAWINSHPVGMVWGLSGAQVTSLIYCVSTAAISYFLGQVLVRPIFTRCWAMALLFIGVSMLSVKGAFWMATASVAVLGVGYLGVTTGIGSSNGFVPIWRRVVYAIAFAAMAWLMFGLTSEAKSYPGLCADIVANAVPQQWLFGFWVPDAAIVALVVAAAIAAYVLGGYFFDYLTRNWIGPAALLVFLVVLVPLDRYVELAQMLAGKATFLLHMLGWLFVGTFIYAVATRAGGRGGKSRWREDRLFHQPCPYPSGIDGVAPLYPHLAVPNLDKATKIDPVE